MIDHLEKALEDLSLPESPARLFDPIRHTLQAGGKRLRPKLTMLGCELAGGDPIKAIPAGVAVELIHNFTLIHDDIMDDAATRRGRPTVYKKWGANDAILSGDYLFALAIEQLGRYKNDHELEKERFGMLYDTLLSGVRTVCEGQSRDMDFETRSEVSLQEYLQMIGQKTAALLKTSIELGALVAKANPHIVSLAGEIGYDAGIAFQIQDDLLDATGNAETFGKVIGGDIREQKKTCLYVLAMEQLNNDEKKTLSKIYASKEPTDKQVDEVIAIFHKTGSITEAQKLMDKYYQRALSGLGEFHENEPAEKIKLLLEQLRNREK